MTDEVYEFPVSFQQERFWLLEQLDRPGVAYNVPCAIRLRGPLDVEALARALDALVARHEGLRTIFVDRADGPRQRVLPPGPLPLAREDLSTIPADGRTGDALARLERFAREPFDLSRGPLVRACLLRLDALEHLFALCLHHIVCDGWSIARLVSDLAAAYVDAPLPPVALQYADFAVWQRQTTRGATYDRLLAFWRTQLLPLPPTLELPADRPRPSVRSFRGDVVRFEIGPTLTARLTTVARARGATRFHALLAAFAAVLTRYTGETDLCIGTPVANRQRRELEPIVGCFVNTLPLRLNLSGNPSFATVLDQAREHALAAFAHQTMPFERIVEALRPERDAAGQPFFRVVLVLQDVPETLPPLGRLALEPVPVDTATAKFDLVLSIAPRGEGLAGRLEYATDLFDRERIAGLAGHLTTLLGAVTASPDRRLSTAPLLTDRDRAALLARSAPREVAVEPPLLHQRFEAWARATPSAVAVECGRNGATLTYAELDCRANQLARLLQSEGVRPGDLVALCLDRSFDSIVAMVAILKAGAAYLPLDPSFPDARLAWLLADARPRVLLSDRDGATRIASAPGAPAGLLVIQLDRERDALAELDPTAVATARPVEPDDLAYVIYTSGSTGTPKGVAVTHSNVVRLFAATTAFAFDRHDTWSLFHSLSFDFSVWEIWGALSHGARLLIVPRAVSRSPESFYDLVCSRGVTVLNQTPSAFRQFATVDRDRAAVLPVRVVIFGGETLEAATLTSWFQRHGDTLPRLVNMYGITETTVHVTHRPLSAGDVDAYPNSPIGAPLADLQLHVLDGGLNVAPAGVPGELYVGGRGLARGYLHRPDLTAERFVPSPFGPEPGARLYRSGDLGVRLATGELCHLGRTDQQVKIRGHRIELGEIEAALARVETVRECAVVAAPDDTGALRLVAYVVPRVAASTMSDLRAALAARLPDYMLPSHIVRLDALPLTANGKLDRGALPSPATRPALDHPFVAPSGTLEQGLASVWVETLGVDRVGAEDTFFELGGDSIRAIRVVALARERNIPISVSDVFRYPTVRALAANLASPDPAIAPTRPFDLVPARDRSRLPPDLEDAYPLSRLQSGLAFHAEHSADYLTYVSSFHVRAPLDLAALQRAIASVVARHPMLRTSFDLGGYREPLQLVHRHVEVPVVVHDLRDHPPAVQATEIARWLDAETRRRFDWTETPLVRVHVHRRSDNAFQFTLTEPFLDGWSVALLLTELFEQYAAGGATGAPSARPPLAASYRDYVALEREALASSAAREFWTRALEGTASRPLPKDEELDAAERPIRRVEVPIAKTTSDALQRLADRSGTPLKSVLLAAHARVVSHLTGARDVVTGLLYNGRPEVHDGDRLIGIFLNAVPLRLHMTPGPWRHLVDRAFEAEQAILPHRRFPLAEIQRLHGSRPLVDTAFNFMNFHIYDGLRRAGGLELIDSYSSEQTYFDLTAQFNVDQETSRVQLFLDVRTAAFGRARTDAIAGTFGRALEALAAAPDARHETCRLLSEAERRRALVQWSRTHLSVDPDARQSELLHDLIARQAARTPDATAVVYEEAAISYRTLERRANRLAHHLRGWIGPDRIVAILMDRSIEMVVSLVAVLKAGGAYLPIEPSLPHARVAAMLEDAGWPLVLTHHGLGRNLAASGPVVLAIDAEGRPVGDAGDRRADDAHDATGAGEPEGPRVAAAGTDALDMAPESGVQPDNLAYVIFTSGSTGRPKGAMNTHRAICNRLRWMHETYRLDPTTDRVLQKTPFGFDVSVWELFWPLIAGAPLIVARPGGHLEPDYLAEAIARYRITTLHFVPSMLAVFLDAVPETASLSSLRRVICSGEALPAATSERAAARFGCEIHNLYGPTEAAVDVTAWPCAETGRAAAGGIVPIGRPIANVQTYVLDDRLEPVPIGTPGELFLAGVQLARGYLAVPGLTAERFLPSPFGPPGARMYRTGDLVRFQPDGVIDFLGRLDHQVKLHGLRIELGEIEAALRAHHGIRDAVAAVREDSAGVTRLVAYAVGRDGTPPAPAELRAFLRRTLPLSMVPTAFVTLPALPLSPNGKVDRRRLPPPPGPGDDRRAAAVVERLTRLSDAGARTLLARRRARPPAEGPAPRAARPDRTTRLPEGSR